MYGTGAVRTHFIFAVVVGTPSDTTPAIDHICRISVAHARTGIDPRVLIALQAHARVTRTALQGCQLVAVIAAKVVAEVQATWLGGKR